MGHTLSCAYDPHFWHLDRHHIVVAKFKLSISAFRFLYFRSFSAASSPVSTFERSGTFISLDGAVAFDVALVALDHVLLAGAVHAVLCVVTRLIADAAANDPRARKDAV